MEAGDKPPATGSHPTTGSQPVAPPTTGSHAALQSPAEQIAGLRAWIAQIDRKLGIRTYALGAAVVLALAAGIVGVVLAQGAKDDSATKAEVAALSDEVNSVSKEASQAAQDDVDTLSSRIDDLEGRVATIASNQRTSTSEVQAAQDDIDDLRNQITDLQNQLESVQSSADLSGGNGNGGN
jgi:polyhydroxyalkanoate synthesis regulator phasin